MFFLGILLLYLKPKLQKVIENLLSKTCVRKLKVMNVAKATEGQLAINLCA